MFARLSLLTILVALTSVAEARGGSVIAAGGQWVALLRGDRCDAESRIAPNAARKDGEGIAGFGFAASGRPWGQFHVRLTRAPRAGASVIAFVGQQSFLLQARWNEAWTRDTRQDRAMIEAVRAGESLRIESRDRSGRRFSNRYGLSFAPTAIDAAAARCATFARR